MSVNDPFVMSAWGNAKGANDKVLTSVNDNDFLRFVGLLAPKLKHNFLYESNKIDFHLSIV